jgi:hypothetical protein
MILSSEVGSSGRQNISFSFGINRPLVSYFLTPEQVAQVSGDWKGESPPVVESLVPELRILRAKAKSLFSEDEKLSLKLSRATEYLKKNKATSSNVIEVDDEEDEWTDIPRGWTLYAISSLSGVVLCMMVVLVILCCKLRRLSGIVAYYCYAQGAGAVSPPPSVLGGHFPVKFTTLPEDGEVDRADTVDLIKEYQQVLGILNRHEFEMLLGLILLVAVVVYVGFRVRKCVRRIRNIRIKTYLGFQFTNPASEVIIKAQLFRAKTDDLRLITETVPVEFHLTGWLFPKLWFRWEAVIADNHAVRAHPVQTEVSISWLEAILLRQMFENEFFVTPILRSHGKTCVLLADKEKKANQSSTGAGTVEIPYQEEGRKATLPRSKSLESVEMTEFPPDLFRRDNSERASSRSFHVQTRRTPLLLRKKKEMAEMRRSMVV